MPPIVAVSGIFFLRDVPKDDIIWLFKALYYITLIHALLYIIQCSTGLPVLGVATPEYDRITHTLRYNNHPVYMTLFFYLSLLFPNYIGKQISKFSAIVFAAAVFITMTRTIMVFVVLFTFLGIFLSGKKSTILKFSIIGAILLSHCQMHCYQDLVKKLVQKVIFCIYSWAVYRLCTHG